jgi:hypothetical protein
MRLKGALLIAKFYENIERPCDPQNMTWPIIKLFLEQWKALMEPKTKDHGLLPKLTKNYPVCKWLESMVIYLDWKVRVCTAPLLCVVWAVALMLVNVPPLQADKPHLEEYGSIEGDLIARMLHNHALFKVDNGSVYDYVESAICWSEVAATIAPFRKPRDGCGAVKALKDLHAGKAIWDCLMKDANKALMTSTWSGTTSVTLLQHMGTHHKAWISLTECAKHIPVDVPNDKARVTYLMDLIKTSDPPVLAAVAAICQDDMDKRVNFTNLFVYLVPACPVTTKAAKKTRVAFEATVAAAAGAKTLGGL